MELEPRFSGCIKELRFTRRDGTTFATPSCEEEDGTEEGCAGTACDNLSLLDSCRNGGTCEAKPEGQTCNCEGTGYSGEKCTTG